MGSGFSNGSVAQLAEQAALNRKVGGFNSPRTHKDIRPKSDRNETYRMAPQAPLIPLGDRIAASTQVSDTCYGGSNPSPPTRDLSSRPLFLDNLAGQVGACWPAQGERRRSPPESPSSSPPSLPRGGPSGKARSSVAYEGQPGVRRQPANLRTGAQKAGRPNQLAQTWTPLLFVRGRGGGPKAPKAERPSPVLFSSFQRRPMVGQQAVNLSRCRFESYRWSHVVNIHR